MDSNMQLALETLRSLTLQIMLISAGVFGIVGGFVASSQKRFSGPWWLVISLVLLAGSVLTGYLIHGILITQLSSNRFDAFSGKLVWLGVAQIALFVVGGALFIVFVALNLVKT